jgi:hypothetical protein
MSTELSFTAEEAVRVQRALRETAGEGPELFPVRDFVAMVSDEIEQLRAQGYRDDAIAAVIERETGKAVGAAAIREYYAPPERRRPPG